MLSTRIATGLIAVIAVLLVLFYMPAQWVIAMIALLITAGGYEWGRFVNSGNKNVAVGYAVLIALLVLAASLWIINDNQRTEWALICGLLFWLLAFVLICRFPMRFSAISSAVAGLLVLLPAFVALSWVYLNSGAGNLLLLLAIIWAADIGAYFAGRRLGRRKLAPAVSPGKTWEGVGGGLLFAALVTVCSAVFFDQPWLLRLIAATGVVALSVVGDLTVSMFKRNANLKDSGNLFPGHGGVMDRIDSISAGAPLFAFILLAHGS